MLKNLPQYVAYIYKAIVNALGLLTALLALGVLPEPYDKWVSTAIAVLTVVVHYKTANGPQPGTVPAVEEFDPEAPVEIQDDWKPAEVITPAHLTKNE